MKNTAFTLAETLITLAIIGVVAAITIPSIVNNIKSAEMKTALKKSYAITSQIVQKAMQENGGQVNGLFGTEDLGTLQNATAVRDFFTTNISTIKTCKGGSTSENCWPKATKLYNGTAESSVEANSYPSLITKDGMMYWFVSHPLGQDLGNGNISYAEFNVDINGFKGPNQYGYDIFHFDIVENKGIVPGGIVYYKGNCSKTDNTIRSGWGCAKKVLLEE